MRLMFNQFIFMSTTADAIEHLSQKKRFINQSPINSTSNVYLGKFDCAAPCAAKSNLPTQLPTQILN